MKQYVTLNRRSKKAQKEYHAKQRRTWGELNPVTRAVPSGKVYNRKKEKRRIGVESRNGFDADFLCKSKFSHRTKSRYFVFFVQKMSESGSNQIDFVPAWDYNLHWTYVNILDTKSRTFPLYPCNMPVNIFCVVDLPKPFGPKKPNISRFSTSIILHHLISPYDYRFASSDVCSTIS